MTTDPFQDGPLHAAMRQFFHGNLEQSRAMLNDYARQVPGDPLVHALRAAIPFYAHLSDRLRLKHANSVRNLILGPSISMPPDLRHEVESNLQHTQALCKSSLAANAKDQNAMLALCLAEGTIRDAMALVFKRWIQSFKHAQSATLYARQLLEMNPEAYDAYFVIGFSEHIIQEIPMIVRPFASIPGIVGSNTRSIQFLEAAARQGSYCREFARQMLIVLYTVENRPRDAYEIVAGLVKEFPGNPGYQQELAKRTAPTSS